MPAVMPKEVKILETAEDIQERREQVLSRYANFKAEARHKREKLEDSRRFQVQEAAFIVICLYVKFSFINLYYRFI